KALTPGATQVQALQSGELDMAFLRGAMPVSQAADAFPGYYEPLSLNDVIQINNREGRPGANKTVRKAIAAAINPKVISQQAFDGQTLPTTEIFPDWSKWHTGVSGYTYDPDKATQLLDQAKDNGYDGNITYVAMNAGSSKRIGQAVESMLTEAGFTVDMQYVQQADILKRLYVDHDFDVTYGSYSVGDAAPLLRMYSALNSTSRNNMTGFTSDEMDQALAEANQAVGEDAEKSAMKDLV